MTEELICVDNVSKSFRITRRQRIDALVDASLTVGAGESIGIVGESGSGKSTLAAVMCGLLRPDHGAVHVPGAEVYRKRGVDRNLWRTIQLVFQDPYASLNPALTIETIVAEPLRMWQGLSWHDARAVVPGLLDRVGLDAEVARAKPRRLSGGQRQRVSIARAIACAPKVIVFDESVSALDVSVQAQILELLRDLRRDTGLAYVFISHDISVIRLISEHVHVMRAGRIVETLPADKLTIDAAQEDYTRRLLEAVPTLVAPAVVPASRY